MNHKRVKLAAVIGSGILIGVLLASASLPRSPGRAAPTAEAARAIASLPQPISSLLESMYRKERQQGTDGVWYELDDSRGVSAMDGVFIFNLAREVRPRRTLEIGFAEGFSAMFFLAALKANGEGEHVAVDPFEQTAYHGVGLQKVREAGMADRFRLIEAKSISGLPQLNLEGRTFDVIFIDGDHRFDAVFTDFILSDEICSKGGYILLHDIWMEATRKVVSYIERNRSDYHRKRVPGDVNMAVFQKVGEDRRGYMHFVDF